MFTCRNYRQCRISSLKYFFSSYQPSLFIRVSRSKFKRKNVTKHLIVSFLPLQVSSVVGGVIDVLIKAIVISQHGKYTLLFNVVYIRVQHQNKRLIQHHQPSKQTRELIEIHFVLLLLIIKCQSIIRMIFELNRLIVWKICQNDT